MEITNLSQTPVNNIDKSISTKKFSLSIIFIILILALTSGFFISRFLPSQSQSSSKISQLLKQDLVTTTDNISNKDQIEVGKTYGSTSKIFSDTATGVVQSGSINGEGTHILVRDGGLSQRVSLTSSNIDLDLFIDHKVEVKGQTNASNKTGWLLDVGSIKVLE